MRQKHGQNFLTDPNIANNIVKSAQLRPTDSVLEIGPGKGILTKIIQQQARSLTAIEIDKDLAKNLSKYFAFENIKIINEDFLKTNLESVFSSLLSEKIKIISNLPYNVGTRIIQKILPLQIWDTAVFMLQKEVAHRLCAKMQTKDYGYISVFTSYYAKCDILFDVSKKCFRPQPKIVSTVVKLTNKFPPKADKVLFDFVKFAFSMRRKTILNSLSSFIKSDKTTAAKIIEQCNLDASLRPERISVENFLKLIKN
ncbi:MAG: 16S rRNA (adenine(1518)-N(6)/adenine(1519)-N(6))-dimethyltransferase RsmA [Elusimicrobiota bacterium]|jgi:16S rRNA (adenine1518-N6/adenine1519-N6)-dimethyltransferase|nr:16S rRNA (adenine(1518)-N(6)/adenine(1519)-N(6))-dimethyltransferase RsmA [Elusimicrobiota bacterium]